MMAEDISADIARETARREVVADAARKAAAEVGELNVPGRDFCDISHIVGAMREAAQAFDAKA
jgi:hypothetical protein